MWGGPLGSPGRRIGPQVAFILAAAPEKKLPCFAERVGAAPSDGGEGAVEEAEGGGFEGNVEVAATHHI